MIRTVKIMDCEQKMYLIRVKDMLWSQKKQMQTHLQINPSLILLDDEYRFLMRDDRC